MNPIKFIALSDLHLGKKLYNLPELAEDLKHHLISIFSQAILLKVDYVVIVGDLYDDNQPKPDMISFVRQQVHRLVENNINVVGIAGDHDKPVNGDTWCQVSDIKPLADEPSFFGFDYFDYSLLSPDWLGKRIADHPNKQQVEWMFLHAQIPSLYPFCEDKKKLDFSTIPIFKHFPKLKGIVLGDIHSGSEGKITEQDKEAFIGYCGSPGVLDASEAVHKKTLLYFDGQKLIRLPFDVGRRYIKITDFSVTFEAAPYVALVENDEKAAVFIVDITQDNRQFKEKLKPLYEVGIVRTIEKHKRKDGEGEETVNIRSELATAERIELVLKDCCKEHPTGVYEVASSLLSTLEDPRSVLDAFKQKMLA